MRAAERPVPMTFTAGWLAEQRWFRAKRRPVASVEEVDGAFVDDAARLVVVEVAYADGGQPDRYLLVTVDGLEPEDGDGAWTALVDAMAIDARLAATHGTFVCRGTDALEALRAGDRSEHRLRVEQSNTSVLVGKRLILKLFRLLEPGENPDLEVGRFLTEVGFDGAPALAGEITYETGTTSSAVAMLLERVSAAADGWAAMLQSLATDSDGAIEGARDVGRVTAGLHAALASRPENAAFPARAATVAETAAWRASAERQLASAVTAVGGEAHDRLVELAPTLRARLADTFGAATGEARVSRIHGDYHLGQLLARDDGGYSVIDFEGEPARPLAERRAPSSPLRDVAGMLRSLDYAARTAQRDAGVDAEAWLPRARAAFLDGYGRIGTGEAALLEAFELEKACYEVRYEANNRPEWLWLPLDAVERLAAA